MNDIKTPPTSLPHPVSAPARRLQWWAAVGAALGFSALAAFQAALALGAPLGRAAWGGSSAHLSTELRIASAVAVGVWLFAAILVLRRAGTPMMPFIPLSPNVARWGVWILVVLLAPAALMNFASPSVWERIIWGPFSLIMLVLCVLVARSATAKS